MSSYGKLFQDLYFRDYTQLLISDIYHQKKDYSAALAALEVIRSADLLSESREKMAHIHLNVEKNEKSFIDCHIQTFTEEPTVKNCLKLSQAFLLVDQVNEINVFMI